MATKAVRNLVPGDRTASFTVLEAPAVQSWGASVVVRMPDGSTMRRFWSDADTAVVVNSTASSVGVAASPTTTSGSFVTIPDMTATLVTTGGPVHVNFSATFQLQTNDAFDVQLYVDDQPVGASLRRVNFVATLQGNPANNAPTSPVSVSAVLPALPAGEHVFTARWRVATGSARARGAERELMVMELN